MRAASLPRQMERENEMIVISYRLFKETLIQSLADFTLVGSDSVIESVFS